MIKKGGQTRGGARDGLDRTNASPAWRGSAGGTTPWQTSGGSEMSVTGLTDWDE